MSCDQHNLIKDRLERIEELTRRGNEKLDTIISLDGPIGMLGTRVTRVEQSVTSAHHRLDDIQRSASSRARLTDSRLRTDFLEEPWPAVIPAGQHLLEARVLYRHRRFLDNGNIIRDPRPRAVSTSSTVTGPANAEITTGRVEGHPCGIEILIDGDRASVCGELPETIFITGFETGDTNLWDWEVHQ